MRLAFVGDLVGQAGVEALLHVLPYLQKQAHCDLVFANAENAAGGLGLTPRIARRLLQSGVAALTLGNHAWDRPELAPWLPQEPRVLRPYNGAATWPGTSSYTCCCAGQKIRLYSLLGQVQMRAVISPFLALEEILKAEAECEEKHLLILDIHAEATAEKAALADMAKGIFSLVVGTHTHVQTADERILQGGTAFITDLGMTGVTDSVIGMDYAVARRRFLDAMPARYVLAKGDAWVQGVLVDLDEQGKASAIQRFRLPGPRESDAISEVTTVEKAK